MNWKPVSARLSSAAIGCLLAAGTSAMAAESMYVFVPTEVRANAMQEQINALCPGIEVTVFGRAKDFEERMAASPPQAILSLLPVIERSSSYNTIAKGLRNGATEEGYMLVSVDKAPDLGKLAEMKIGVMDLLGRKSMNDFIAQIFQTGLKQVKRVTKIEDLLPLLTFGSVDAIFVSESFYGQLKQKSNLSLVAARLNVKIGLTSAALTSDAAKDKFQQCIARFDKNLNDALGVEQWRTL